ncbi:hypothetical protein BOX15_Mlig033122g1, partial [Macrostomum lignano]
PSQLMNESIIVIDSDDDEQQQQQERRRQKQRALVTASIGAMKARSAVAMPQQPQPPQQPHQQNYAGSLQSVKLGGFVPLNCTVTGGGAGTAAAAAAARSRRFKETPRGRKSTGGLCVSSALRLGGSPSGVQKQPQQQTQQQQQLSPIVKQALLTNGRVSHSYPPPAPAATKPLPPAATYDSVIENENNYIDYTEYFYCRELDPLETVVTPPAAGPFAYNCCVCSAQMPCSDAAAKHILEHLLSARIHRANLTAHTRCHRCLRSFQTPARMQRHLSRAHPDCLDESALVCRICELHFDTDSKLADHLAGTHPPRDMPYRCELCAHRSSSHADLIQHFYSFHACSGELLCYFCLKVFRFPNGTGSSPAAQSLSPYYSHLRAHLADSCSDPHGNANSNGCPKCKLHFLSRQSLKQHLDSAHIGKCFTVAEVSPVPSGATAAAASAAVTAAAGTRSLNAAPASRLCGLAQLKFKVKRQETCLECLQPMSLPGHYQRQHLCPACRYVTCCVEAFARHERRHRTAASTAAATSAAPAALGDIGVGSGLSNPAFALYCLCGFATVNGDAMAMHAASGCRLSVGVSSSRSGGSAASRWQQPGSTVRLIRRVRHRPTRLLRHRRSRQQRQCSQKRQQLMADSLGLVGAAGAAAAADSVGEAAADLTVPSGVPLLESVGLAKRAVSV